jgi:hypothetical protein
LLPLHPLQATLVAGNGCTAEWNEREDEEEVCADDEDMERRVKKQFKEVAQNWKSASGDEEVWKRLTNC